MIARLRVAHSAGLELRTTGIVVAEVWRDRVAVRANLARLLKSVDVRAVDDRLGRAAGVLLGCAGRGQAVDATVIAIAVADDRIVTNDSGDIAGLVQANGASDRRSGLLKLRDAWSGPSAICPDCLPCLAALPAKPANPWPVDPVSPGSRGPLPRAGAAQARPVSRIVTIKRKEGRSG